MIPCITNISTQKRLQHRYCPVHWLPEINFLSAGLLTQEGQNETTILEKIRVGKKVYKFSVYVHTRFHIIVQSKTAWYEKHHVEIKCKIITRSKGLFIPSFAFAFWPCITFSLKLTVPQDLIPMVEFTYSTVLCFKRCSKIKVAQ